MLYAFYGTDRAKARAEMQKAVEKYKGYTVLRITDAHTKEDLVASFMGGGMFVKPHVVQLEGVLENEELRPILLDTLAMRKQSTDVFLILEEKPDTATKKLIAKYADGEATFDVSKSGKKETTIFALANALRAGDKKALWVGLQREWAAGNAPEAVHGVLFWAAKDMFLKSRNDKERSQAQKLAVALAVLPHESRREGEELHYALERFVLTNNG